jgi:hypothetical protein
VTSGTLSSIERLWFGAIGYEAGTVTTTADADYTTSGTANSGTAGPSGISTNIESRIATITADTFNPTLSGGTDWVAILVALAEVPAAAALPITESILIRYV